MKLVVLNDNFAGKKCSSEHGLSFLIEADKKILFDAGQSDVFEKNAKILNVSLDDVEYIVLSHGHFDHGNGLKYLKNKKLICHPDCFIKRYKKENGKYVGLPITLEEAKKKYELILSKKPYKISETVTFLGEIPRMNDFESKKADFCKDGGDDDFVSDDSAITIKSNNGLIVIAGCSHAGICNIIEYAKAVNKTKKVYAVAGGFHLKKADDVTKKTIDYFKKEKIRRIYPSHCTELAALSMFYQAFKIEQIHSGDIIDL